MLRNKECYDIFENLLISDENVEIKIEAAKAFGRLKNKRALKPLKWILESNSNNNNLKINVLRAIANIRFQDPEIELFIKQLNCKDLNIKKCIKNRLINLGPIRLINSLLNSLKEENISKNLEITLLKLIGYELSGQILSQKNSKLVEKSHPEIISILLDNKDFLIEILITVFEEDDYQLNNSVLIILKLLGDEIYPILINFLNNEEVVIKKNAIILIGKLKIKEAANILIQNLNSIYEEITIATVQALGEIGDLSIISKLLIILDIEAIFFDYNDFDIKWYIIESVKKIYFSSPNPSYESLYYSLNFDNHVLKSNIALLMGELGESEFLHSLLILLEEDDFEVKKNSIIALGKIGRLEAIDPLLGVLESKDIHWILRRVSIDAIDNLFREYQNRIGNINIKMEPFFTIKIDRLIDFLEKNNDEYYKIRISLIKLLETHGGKTAIGVILKYVNDFYGIVRITASKAIKTIENRLKIDNKI